jgi:hypothetical protein
MKFDERNQFFFKSPLFCFHGICGIVCSPDSDFFLAYLVPLDVDVVTNKFHQFLFDHFCVFQFFNGYLQGVKHAAPYGDHFDLLWWPF